MSQIQNVPEIENTRAIRAILENSSRKSKDNAPVMTSLTLPKQNFNYNRGNGVNIVSSTNMLYRAKYETDVSNYIETKPSHKISSQYLIENDNSSPNSLGILTPASSPNSVTYEKMICSEDDKSSNYDRMSNYASMSMHVDEPSLPLTPVTPQSNCHINFPVDGIVTN